VETVANLPRSPAIRQWNKGHHPAKTSEAGAMLALIAE
jgi:hypothetical protein